MYYSPKSSMLRNTTAEQLGSLSFLPSLLLTFTHRAAHAQEYSLGSLIPALMLFVSWNLGWCIFIGSCGSLIATRFLFS